MLRKLFIIRHGKSSWESLVNDIDRPLTERGVKNSYEMAERFLRDANIPEMIFSSPANRAFHTALIMSRVWNIPDHKIQIANELYLPDIDDILSFISGMPDEVSSVAIFGHNPGFTHFANRYLRGDLENLPTAGVVVLSMELEKWNDIVKARVEKDFVDYPKNTR